MSPILLQSLFLLAGLGLGLPASAKTSSAPTTDAAHAAQATTTPTSVRVLLVGNSLSYVNNLPLLFDALAAQQPPATRYHADLIAAPGGSLAERWQDGVAATEINSDRWQVLVLQERGGVLACLASAQTRDQPECLASLSAQRKFAQLAKAHGMRVIVLGTWGPDSIWQSKLSRGLRNLAKTINSEALDAGPVLRDYARAHPQTAMTSDATLHPSLDGSLLMAALLYRQVSGTAVRAAPLAVRAALLPPNAHVAANRLLSAQLQLAGDGAVIRVDVARLQPLLSAAASANSAAGQD